MQQTTAGIAVRMPEPTAYEYLVVRNTGVKQLVRIYHSIYAVDVFEIKSEKARNTQTRRSSNTRVSEIKKGHAAVKAQSIRDGILCQALPRESGDTSDTCSSHSSHLRQLLLSLITRRPKTIHT